MKPRLAYAAVAAVVVVAAVIAIAAIARRSASHGGTPVESGQVQALGQRTKTSGCLIAAALPDAACTPGAIFADAGADKICRAGYASSVRNVPTGEKNQVYAEYGIASHRAGQYEVDHLISLELGGSNDIANLWPEAASPQPGYHEKDRFENYLHDQVCSGRVSLAEAQSEIAHDWLTAWTDAGKP